MITDKSSEMNCRAVSPALSLSNGPNPAKALEGAMQTIFPFFATLDQMQRTKSSTSNHFYRR